MHNVTAKLPWHFIYNLLLIEDLKSLVAFVCRDRLTSWGVGIANHLNNHIQGINLLVKQYYIRINLLKCCKLILSWTLIS